MFSGEKLNAIQRRKRTVVARGDLLRAECGEIWNAAGRRAVSAIPRKLRVLTPVAMALSVAGLSFAKMKLGPKHRFFGAACSAAGLALLAARRKE